MASTTLNSPGRIVAHVANLRRFSSWALLLVVGSFAYSDYWSWSAGYYKKPGDVDLLLSGNGLAPAQYRVGIIFLSSFLSKATHGHLAYRHWFAILDFIFALGMVWLVRALLMRSRSFLAASPASQWLRIFVLLGLSFYYLTWAISYQRQETTACALFVALSMYLLSTVRSAALLVPALVALAAVQGVIRADVAILFHAGLFLYVLVRGARGFLVSRGTLLVSSFLGAVAPTGILWFIMHKVYPHATYGDTKVFQLGFNMAPGQLLPFALFIAPVVYTYLRARHADVAEESDGLTKALLLGAALYFVSWALVGRLEEVRIFVPFAFALIPLTANAVASSVAGEKTFAVSGERAA